MKLGTPVRIVVPRRRLKFFSYFAGVLLLLILAAVFSSASNTSSSDLMCVESVAAAGVETPIPFDGVSRIGIQEYRSGAYTSIQMDQLRALRQSGVDVVRYGNIQLFDYASGGSTTNRGVYATQIAQLSSLGYTVVVDFGLPNAANSDYPINSTNGGTYVSAIKTAVTTLQGCPQKVRVK